LTKSHFPSVDFNPDPELSEAENLQRLEDYITEKEALLIGLFEPSEGDSQQEHTVQGCIVINLSRSWFDKLTTND